MGSPPPNKRGLISFQDSEPKITEMDSKAVKVRDLFDISLGDDEAIENYRATHNRLLQLERKDAWDHEARPDPTSLSQDDQVEQEAAFIIQGIREYERRVTFGNLASEAIPGPNTRDMGGQFLTNKDRIDNESLLYKIATWVPKGCLLHLHFNAELHPERLLERARSIENIYIRSIRPLLSYSDLAQTEMVFNVLDPNQVENNVDIFSSNYPGNATNWKTDEWKWKVWMPWETFQKAFEKKFGAKYKQSEPTSQMKDAQCCSEPGRQVNLGLAEDWLKKKMVLSEEEAYNPSQTVNG